MREKFWLVKNGMLGTAHYNREGVVVDFRPVDKEPVLQKEGSSVFIIIEPPRRVDAERLCLEAVRRGSDVLEESISFVRILEIWSASFEGVEFSCSCEVRENKNTPEEVAHRASCKKELEEIRKEWKRRETFIGDRLSKITPEEFATLANLTSAEWSGLERTSWDVFLSAPIKRVAEFFQKAAIPEDFSPEVGPKWRASDAWKKSLREGLLELKQEEKARRKAEYFARQT